MKKIFPVMLLLAYASVPSAVSAQSPAPRSKTPTAQMTYAINELGTDHQLPLIKAPKNEFSIISNTGLKPSNFVSATEKYYSSQISAIDTTVFPLMFLNWKTMSHDQKLTFMEERKLSYAQTANSLHKLNNAAQQLIYMVNNTDKDIVLQVQDNSFIGILEAFDDGKWKPVQFWRYSKCGNSYSLKHIAPGESALYITPVHIGDHPVQLRYKVLGTDKFYYSNTFDGHINLSDFYATSSKMDKLEAFREWRLGE